MNFDRLAPYYRLMEAVAAGGKLQQCRLAFLDEIPEPRRVLLAGEGHGRFLPECVKRFPGVQVTVLDSSQVMLEIAKEKIGSGCEAHVEFVHSDVVEWVPPQAAYDLIVTHFFLDCFSHETLAAIVAKVARAATPDAHWLLADFQIANGRFAALRSRWILGMLYRFFRITCKLEGRGLVAPDEHLFTAGFTCYRHRSFDWGLLKSEWWRR